MAFITDLEIAELQKTLTTRETAFEVLNNSLPLLRNLFSTILHANTNSRREDRVSVHLLPEGFESWMLLSSTVDGNCLFHSASYWLEMNHFLEFYVY